MRVWSLDRVVEGLRQGEPQAVDAFVAQFEGLGRRLAAALLADAHEAEDAVQEAFVEAIRLIAALREPRGLPGWFRQIVRTQANRLLRRRRETTVAEWPDVAGEAMPPEQRLEGEEARQRIRRAMERLTPASQQPAELFYQAGLRLSEVADLMGLPEGTVKRRLHDARRQLRDILVDEFGIARAGDDHVR